MKTSIGHDNDALFGQVFQQCLFKPVLEENAIYLPFILKGSKQFTRALRRGKPNSSMALAADADVDAHSAFTACIVAIWLIAL